MYELVSFKGADWQILLLQFRARLAVCPVYSFNAKRR